MSDLIKRTDVIKAILSKPAWHSSDGSYYHSSDIKDAINNLPSTERPKGKWVGAEYDGYADGQPVYDAFECSNCGEIISATDDTLTPFCPYCGADMRGVDNEVD